jgi:fumarylacetoacetase
LALAETELGLAFETRGDTITAFRNFREALFEAFRQGSKLESQVRKHLMPAGFANLLLPADSWGYVDFYAGIHHASNVGKMFRPDQPPLLPNYRHLPIAYNGRACTLVPTRTEIPRPWGQVKTDAGVEFVPTRELDFELEVGWYVGRGSNFGEPIPVEEAEDHILGLVLVNDWSARDVQRWEYQPLGPFLAKSFATSVSPWIVSLDALKPFRVPGMPQEPTPLPHLAQPANPHFDIELEVEIRLEDKGEVVSKSNLNNLYWSIAQQLAHLTSNGCNVEVGDLCATGTLSGEAPGTYGSMLELSWRGTQPVKVLEQTRTFLEDDDEVVFRGGAGPEGARVGFGELRNQVIPAASKR